MPSTWTTTLPTGSTRIRLAPNILQDRWLNIEQGEVPSDKWQLQRQGSDPTSIASTGLIYTKDGGNLTSDLFYEDDAGTPNIVRLTTTDGIGGLTQKVYANSIIMKPGATEITNTQKSLCCAFGFFTLQTVNGTYAPDAGSYNITNYIRTSTGHYTVTLAFTATGAFTYLPLLSVRKVSSSQVWQINIVDQTTTTFDVRITENGSLSDADFCAAIFGAFT